MISGYTGERLLLTLWVGCLWSIGYLAVPMAFANLEVMIAGDYAGKLFYAVNIIGISCAVILLISRLFIFGLKRFHLFWRSWLLLLMLAMSLAFVGYLQPEMHAIKLLEWQTNVELASRFGELHKISESLYLMLSLLGLMLVLTTDKRAEADTAA